MFHLHSVAAVGAFRPRTGWFWSSSDQLVSADDLNLSYVRTKVNTQKACAVKKIPLFMIKPENVAKETHNEAKTRTPA
jgi:hypothetical protein